MYERRDPACVGSIRAVVRANEQSILHSGLCCKHNAGTEKLESLRNELLLPLAHDHSVTMVTLVTVVTLATICNHGNTGNRGNTGNHL